MLPQCWRPSSHTIFLADGGRLAVQETAARPDYMSPRSGRAMHLELKRSVSAYASDHLGIRHIPISRIVRRYGVAFAYQAARDLDSVSVFHAPSGLLVTSVAINDVLVLLGLGDTFFRNERNWRTIR